jgi:tRNA(Ile2)-agmatinylcytidine synthase
MWSPLHIGIDDTDSTRKGCTTYIASLLLEQITKRDGIFTDYPTLIRLNPNVPWKTRGNGAIGLRIRIPCNSLDQVIEDVIQIVQVNSDLDAKKTDPGIVIFVGHLIPKEFTIFSKKTEQDIVKKQEALTLIQKYGAKAFSFKYGRGIIGALAAVGETLIGDHTYELISYRIKRNRGTPRQLDETSVFRMDKLMNGLTFNNVDYEKRGVLITPRGPDPVFLGIRGESTDAVKKAFSLLTVQEEVERWMIFRTNQGTDAHLKMVKKINQIQPYHSVIVQGTLSRNPISIPGRHVIFTIADDTKQIDCAAYEPTGKFRNIIKALTIGDVVKVYGGVRPSSKKIPMTINLEKIEIIYLIPKTLIRNPTCTFCNKHMESMGKDKGFRCKKCGVKDRKTQRVQVQVKRIISTGLYIPPPRANRHLTKPHSRYGLEKTFEPAPPSDFWGRGSIPYNFGS